MEMVKDISELSEDINNNEDSILSKDGELNNNELNNNHNEDDSFFGDDDVFNDGANHVNQSDFVENTTVENKLNLTTDMLSDLKTSIRSGEQQTKVVSENIEKIENHFPQLVQDMNLYTVRSAKLRDAGDNFSKSIQEYAASETPALRQGLSAFAECFATVQDHRNVLVTRLENKVAPAFTVYETRCKQAKIDVKQHNIAHTKELSEHKSYERVRTKSTQQFQLAKAEAKFKKASEEANRSAQILNDQVTEFERQKVRDLKKVFGEFMLSEMLFYAKTLEIYTRAYQELMNVDEDINVQQLQESMKWEPHQFASPQQPGHSQMYGGSAPVLSSPQQAPNSPSAFSHQGMERTL